MNMSTTSTVKLTDRMFSLVKKGEKTAFAELVGYRETPLDVGSKLLIISGNEKIPGLFAVVRSKKLFESNEILSLPYRLNLQLAYYSDKIKQDIKDRKVGLFVYHFGLL